MACLKQWVSRRCQNVCDDEKAQVPEGNEFQTEETVTLKQQRLCRLEAVERGAIYDSNSVAAWFLLDVKIIASSHYRPVMHHASGCQMVVESLVLFSGSVWSRVS